MVKRIFIVQNTPLGAPLPLSVYLTGLLSNFKKSGKCEINLLIGKSEKIAPEIKKVCKKIYQFEGSTYSIKDNFKFGFWVNSVLRKEHTQKPIDVVHCFYPNSSLLGAVLFKKKNRNVKLIYDVRSPWIDMSIERGFINKGVAPLYRWALYTEERYLCKFVDTFLFITEGLRKYYEDNVGIRKNQEVYVSPSGIDVKKFQRVKTNVRKRFGVRENEILVGSVGGIANVRKLHDYLYLFRDVVKKNKKVKLMFVGDGDSLGMMKEMVEQLDLRKNVIFTGKVEHSEVPRYISAFDFGLCHLPNIFIYENSFPLKILEYLSCGVPVLASELKAHREISKNLKGVYVYRNAGDILRFIGKNRGKTKTDLAGYDWRNIVKVYEKIWRVKR